MGVTARRRPFAKRPPVPGDQLPDIRLSLPPSVKIIPPPRVRLNPLSVVIGAGLLLVVAASGYFGYRTFSDDGAEEPVADELQDVVMETPPAEPEHEPEAQPEPEPEPETDPADDFPDLLAESEDATGPGNAVALDLALGTGHDGMAVGGGVTAGTRGATRAAYDPGQVERNPEPEQAPVPPEMPRKAVEQGISGTFVATFVVNASGRVESIEIDGTPTGYGFEASIRASLQKRRYKPAMAGGVPVPVRIRQPFDFRLE